MCLAGLAGLWKSHSEPEVPQPQSLYLQAKEFPGRPVQEDEVRTRLNEKTDSATRLAESASRFCEKFEMQVETLPLPSLLADLKDGKIKLPNMCESDEATTRLFQALRDSCSAEELKKEINGCEQNLFSYRARRIQLWAADQPVQSLSLEVIMQRFFGLLNAELPMGQLRGEDLRDIARELKKRIPESGTPSRIEAVSYFFDADPSPAGRLALRQALQEARRQNPEDWQIFEFQLMQEAQEDLGRYKQMIQRLLAQQPDSLIGVYHSACLLWKQKQKAQALDLFRKAADMDPKENRFRETYEKARLTAPDFPVCTASMRFSPDQF
jgi:hypothetical protein